MLMPAGLLQGATATTARTYKPNPNPKREQSREQRRKENHKQERTKKKTKNLLLIP